MTPVRPERLHPLFSSVESLKGVGSNSGRALGRLGIRNVRDLLLHLPRSVVDRQRVDSIADVEPSTTVTVRVEVGKHLKQQRSGQPNRIVVRDARSEFMLVYFGARGNQLERLMPAGSTRFVSGKVEQFGRGKQIVHPDHVVGESDADSIPAKEPVYPLADGISNRVMRRIIAAALDVAPDLEEWHDRQLLEDYRWPSWLQALQILHSASGAHDDSDRARAMERLAFDELTANQFALLSNRKALREASGSLIRDAPDHRSRVLDNFGCSLTGSQETVLDEILSDLAAPERMLRLLQGDVGSGKTILALLALATAGGAGGQGMLMAPTDILARQQHETCKTLFADTGIEVELLTGQDRGSRRDRILTELKSGGIDIVVGTHALIQPDVEFRDLQLAVIDEQHKFGVEQRRKLVENNPAANLLMMTATPIPRSLALVNYGETDMSTLTEKPAGRSAIRTAAMPSSRTPQVAERLKAAVDRGRQAFWICPVVEENDDQRHWSAEQRASDLSAAVGPVVDFVHGQMPNEMRVAAMERFVRGETRVLVATTVVEVGMDVPSATIIVIESAERFGLAQLHQLRGRVGRGREESACVLIYNPPLQEVARQRIAAIRETEDGFKIADADLKLRGQGDLLGLRQSGGMRFRCADPASQLELLERARASARSLGGADPKLLTVRGQAIQCLLFLFGQDQVMRPSAV